MVILIINISALERSKPIPNAALVQERFFHFLTGDTPLNIRLLLFQFVKAVFGSRSNDTLLYCRDKVLYFFLNIFQFSVETVQVGGICRFFFDYFHSPFCNKGDIFISQHILNCVADYQFLYPVFSFGFLFTSVFPLGFCAFVVIMHLPCFRCTALTDHRRPAVTAEQLGSQQIVFVSFRFSPCFPVVFEHSLYFLKQYIVYDSGHTIGNNNVHELVCADVFLISENRSETVFIKSVAPCSFVPTLVAIGNDLCRGHSIGV